MSVADEMFSNKNEGTAAHRTLRKLCASYRDQQLSRNTSIHVLLSYMQIVLKCKFLAALTLFIILNFLERCLVNSMEIWPQPSQHSQPSCSTSHLGLTYLSFLNISTDSAKVSRTSSLASNLDYSDCSKIDYGQEIDKDSASPLEDVFF